MLKTGWLYAGVVVFLPPIEGLWGDAKVTAGQADIVTTGVVVIKPFEFLSGFPG